MRSLLQSLPVLLLLGLTFAACDSAGTDASGRVRVLMTDAPADEFAHAYVTVVRVELVGEGGTRVLSDSARTLDLLTLRNGVTTTLAAEDVPEGDYSQLRFILADTARIVFLDGGTSTRLKVPSGTQTGIKLNLPDFEIDDDADEVEVLVDFDVNDSFVKAGVSGQYLFKPVLKTKRFEINGVIVPTDTTAVPSDTTTAG